jgi:ABC-type hemin transport system ATPase subunit
VEHYGIFLLLSLVQYTHFSNATNNSMRVLLSMRQLTKEAVCTPTAGDKRFQEKCDGFLLESRTPRWTVLLATHNLNFVNAFCDRTLGLHKGRQMAFGPTGSALPQYLDITAK